MTRKDLLRLGANVSNQLRSRRNDTPGGLSVVRKLSAESTWTRGHATRIAWSKDFSCFLDKHVPHGLNAKNRRREESKKDEQGI
jgi:hypothetical protein